VREGGTAIRQIKHAIWNTVRRAAKSNQDFSAALSGNPESVWRYPPLIERALGQMGWQDPSVQFRAAQDRLTDTSGMSLLSTLNLINAAMSTAAWITSAAPPVSLALAVTGAVLGLADTVQDYLNRVEQEDAFNAVLDPSKSVGSQPGYLGIVVAIGFAILDLKGVKDALGATRILGQADSAIHAVALVAT
jgi:hypothetical protein